MNDMETLDSPDGIAIIGMTCRFPGAQNSGMFWKNLCEGAESITFFSDAELLQAGVNPEILKEANYVKAKPILEDQSYFDAAFFEINPREAEMIDPQHRFFLECSWEALENAGYDPQAYRNRIGVYAGADPSQYMRDHLIENRNEMLTLFGNDNSYLCTRISYKLNLKGPSVSVQTACSTSLVAVHMACQSLLDGECDMALAGGVSFNNGFQPQGYWYEKEGIRSPDGHCRAFDAQAKGTVFGSGIGIVVLKRLGDALSDGDHILAVIRGSAINNDGALKIGYTAPSIDGQAAVIIGALDAANVHPETIGYIEAHGTGTLLGDPIEITALSNAFRRVTDKRGFCAIGSVKTNVGHLSAAAGVAGLIKTVLCLKNKKLVPSLHFTEPNPALHLRESPFYVNTELREWKSNGHPRRAGVSSFGIGGTNAHVIVEEAPKAVPADPGKAEHLILLSAKTEEALIQASENFIHFFKQHPEAILADSAYTLQVGRRTFEHRRMFVCNSIANAVSALETNDPERVRSSYEKARHRPLYFMFPGQGSQYANMGHSLYENESLFRSEVDRCAEILQPRLGLDLRQVLYPVPGTESESGKRLEQTALTQPALFVIEYALAKLWMSWGLKPEGMIGHSIGEYVAACLAEVFTLEEALALVAQRGRLLQSLPRGSMLGLPMAEAELRAYIKEPLSIAAVNGPKFCTVSGPDEAIAELESQLTRKDIPCRRLRTSHAFHSVMVEPILEEFTMHVKTVKLKPSRIPFISNVTGTWITTEEAVDPGYWAKHMRQTVRFGEGINLLLKEPDAVLLETGPGRTLSVFAKQGPARTVLNSLPHPEDKTGDRAFLLQALGRLWLAGFKVDWQGFYGEERRRRLPLPTYPFARDRYWVEPSRQPAQAKPKTAFPKNPNTADWFYIPHWKPANIPHPVADQKVWLIFGQDPQLTKRLKALGHTVYTVQPGAGFGIGEDRENAFIHPQQPEEYDRLLQALDRDPQRIVYLAGKDFDMYGLVFLAQALGRKPLTNIRLDVITNHGQGVIQRDTVDPLQAMVLGPALVISQEYPGLVCHVIDLFAANRQQIDRLYDHLLAELTAEPEEKIAAYRGSQRWVRRFEAIPPFGDVSRSLRKNGVYLLTGGFGKIGRTLARHLARDFQAKLVLISRSGLPPRTAWEHWLLTHEVTDATAAKIRFIQELEEQGAEVLVQTADVAVSDQMQTVIKRTLERFDVLHGVLHLAGIIGNESFKLIQEVTKETCETQFRPKVQGTLVLAEVLQDLPLDFCMLFSSLASVLGGLGLGVYAAANCFMDGIAQQQNRLGSVPWFCMNWDSWRFKNGSADEDPEAGIVESAMTPEEGIQAFKQALDFDQGLNQIFISTHDLNRRMETWVGPGAMVRDLPRSAAQQYSRPHLQNPYIAPENEIEQRLVEIWQELLGIERIGVNDNFFELGGHSLLATQMISHVRQRVGAELSLRQLFATPTISALARHIDKTCAPVLLTKIPVTDRKALLPLSYAQQRLWFLDQMEPGGSAYNLPMALRIKGRVDREALEQSLHEIVRRHATLRTTFETREDLGVQVIATRWQGRLQVIDLREKETDQDEEEVKRLVGEEAQRPFDLSRGPLLRAGLWILGDQESVLVITMHHIVSDGWSLQIFWKELGLLYEAFCKGESSPLPELSVQYVDFGAWQREWLRGPELERQLGYWKEKLKGAPAALELPLDHPRPPIQSYRGKKEGFILAPEILERLEQLSQKQGVTLFMTLLAAFKILLYRYTSQVDILVGTLIAGRNRAEIEDLIGFFVNTLVLRTDLEGRPRFKELLARVKETALGAYGHQDLPFEKLVEELQPERDLSRSPLFQVMFALQNIPWVNKELPGTETRPLDFETGTSMFDLTLFMVSGAQGLSGWVEYGTDLFEQETIRRMIGHFKTMVEGIIVDPDRIIEELPFLTQAEEHRLLVEWNDTHQEYPKDKCIPELFAEQAARTPDALAVVFEEQCLCYAELNRRANQLAHYLQTQGIGPESLVGICLERSPEMVIALLAVLKAGGAYVPMDPNYPQERLAFMIEDSKAQVLLTQSNQSPVISQQSSVSDLSSSAFDRSSPFTIHHSPFKIILLDTEQQTITAQCDDNPNIDVQRDSLAYVIYTSGSTGRPKGVQIPHQAVINFLYSMMKKLEWSPEERMLAITSLSFDIAGLELYLPLISGAGLEIVERRTAADGEELCRRLEQHGMTAMQATPVTWRMLLASGWSGEQGFKALCGGEALAPDLAQQLSTRGVKGWNLYGPTETAIWSTSSRLSSGEALSIGRPIDNTQIYILDHRQRPVPEGVAGELYIGGVGLSRGYRDQPDLTAEKFIPNPFSFEPGARLYRTGDLTRYLPNGNIEYLGRIDFQIKIRGFRIELGEIEAALIRHPQIKEAVMLAREDNPGDIQLAAYIVAADGNPVDITDLRDHLKTGLPDYMIPSAFVVLVALPLTPNGKIDRKALPVPEKTDSTSDTCDRTPRSAAEQKIAAIWCEVLGMENVGVHSNFFDLGGHSLLVIRVHQKLKAAFDKEISVRDLFRYTTIAALALYFDPTRAQTDTVIQKAAERVSARASGLESTDIAIIAMAGCFPGAKTLEQFWENLQQGKESITFFSDAELLAAGVDPEQLKNPYYVKARGIVSDKDCFDARFFGVNPREAELMDPQQRIFLEHAWQALEKAGCDPKQYEGRIGVYAGAAYSTYLLYNLYRHADSMDSIDPYQVMISNDKDFLATQVSYKLGLNGPCMTVQTACSTSLVAVYEACQSLLNQKCDIALAGGVALGAPSLAGYLYIPERILSPDGHCRVFDAKAQGTVGGQGLGLVVLKRLRDALKDHDTIYAVIKASAVNNDGNRKIGYTAPSEDGQAEVITEALALAAIKPESIGYVEAHGTGTALGDPIEVAALTRAFRGHTQAKQFCALGSVKSNIGHLDTAAGVAGLIKAVLCLRNKQLVPSLHYTEPNPTIDFQNSPFYVNTELREWKSNGRPRRAGVSSFGIGGTNAHVILEEAPEDLDTDPGKPEQLILLSAKTREALDQAGAHLAAFLRQYPETNLADAAHTLQTGRKTFEHRLFLVGANTQGVAQTLEQNDPNRIFCSFEKERHRPLCFMFPGQGAQYVNMGHDLYQSEPLFKAEVDRCAEILQAHLGLDLRQVLYPDPESAEESQKLLEQTALTQPALFTIEYSLAKLWMSWGMHPQAMIGHSIGEYAAACLAEVFTLKEALQLVAERGRLLQSLACGSMLSVQMAEPELQPYLKEPLSLAAVNSPKFCTLSGPHAVVDELEALLKRQNIPCRRLHTSHAFHSGMVEPILKGFGACVQKVSLRRPRIPFVSNVTGTWIKAEEAADPGYWVKHLRLGVRFGEGVQTLLKEPDAVLLEVGPGRTLSIFARQQQARTVVNSLPHPEDKPGDRAFLLNALGRLWLAGLVVDWRGFYGDERRRRIPLPTYAFERQRYWIEPADGPIRAKHGTRPISTGDPTVQWEGRDKPGAATTEAKHSSAARQYPRPNLSNPYVAPSGDTEQKLGEICRELLGVEPVGVHDNFFELGGHSLLATQVISRLRQVFQVELPMRTLFEEPTIKGMAKRIETELRKEQGSIMPTIEPVTRDQPLPLSFAQERLWFLDQLEPGTSVYNIPLALRIRGGLDMEILEQSLRGLVQRHETLRTTFETREGQGLQTIAPEWQGRLERIDLGSIAINRQEAETRRLVEEEAQRPFDLNQGPLFRAIVMKLGDQDYVFIFNMHHIISDGWSVGILQKELWTLYRTYAEGKASSLAELPIQYADFAIWQRKQLQGPELDRQLAFWKDKMQGAPAALDLPVDQPRPLIQSFQGAVERFELSPEILAGLEQLNQKQGVTLFMTLLAIFKVLLYRYTSQTDIVIGTPIAGRNRAEIEGLIGFFVNTLVLRTRLDDRLAFHELLAQVKETALGAYAHQDLPFEKLVEELQPERDLSRSPLFQVMFVLQNTPWTEPELPGMEIKYFKFSPNSSQFDFTLYLMPDPTKLSGRIEYNRDLFEQTTILRLIEHFRTLVQGVIAGPDRGIAELPLLTPMEERKILFEWNDTDQEYPQEKCLPELFEEQTARTPNAVAVVFEEQCLSYAELNRRANRLAHYLQIQGVGPESLVGICLGRSLEMVIALLGVLKAGGAYVPMDPNYPQERLAFMLEDSGARILLTQSNQSPLTSHQSPAPDHLFSLSAVSPAKADSPSTIHHSRFKIIFLDTEKQNIAEQCDDNPNTDVQRDNPAYVIYTSGSTGQPKGVVITHQNATALIHWAGQVFEAEALSGVLASTSICFDLSIFEIFVPLSWGGRVILVENALYLAGLEAAQAVTLVNTVPSAMRELVQIDGLPESVNVVNLAGEPLTTQLVQEIYKRKNIRKVYDLYGPTEDTTYSTYALRNIGGPQTIGRPIANTRMYVLDSRMKPVPMGVAGELYIAGAGLARGYLNRPDLTAEKFIPDPFSSEPDGRLYKTGDLCRYLKDGNLEYLGRIDFQVKVRGFRIEPGEIENILSRNAQVREAIVLVREDRPGDKRLAAYVTAKTEQKPDPSDLRQYLKAGLPEYMVPSAFVVLDSLPLTPNGKVDRKALPVPDMPSPQSLLPVPLARSADVTDWFYAPVWKESEPPSRNPLETTSRWLVFGDRKHLSKALVRRLRKNGLEVMMVREGKRFRVRKNGYTIRPALSQDYHTLITELQEQDRLPNTIIHLWNIAPLSRKVLENPDKALIYSYYSPLFLAQALGREKRTQTLNLTLVSSHMQKVVEEDMLQPAKAALSGLCRIVPQELAQINCRSMDVALPRARSQEESQLIEQIIKETESASEEAIIAYRGHKRWVQFYEPRIPALGGNILREGGVYLITDGPEGLGLNLARYLARKVRARIVLITDTPLPEPGMRQAYLKTHEPQDPGCLLIRAVEEWESLNLPGLTLRAEVSNPEQMKAAVRAACRNFDTIHGVIHAAGSGRGQRILSEDFQSSNKVWVPSIQGIQVLKSVLEAIKLDFILLCSPLSSLVGGGLGRGAPSAAAGVMAAFTQAMDKSLNYMTIYWDKEISTGEQTDEVYARLFSNEAVGRELIVSTCPLTAVMERSAQITALQAQEAEADLLAGDPASAGGTEEKLALIWKDLLGVRRITANDSFFRVGGHSLVAIRLIKRVRETFNVDLSVRASFEAPTIAELAKRIEEAHKEK